MRKKLNDKKDIFISFKKTNIDNREVDTKDLEIAQKLYEELEKENIPTFFSERSIFEVKTDDYQKEIDQRIKEAKIMIVIGTDSRHIFQPGVANEWKKFIDYMELPLEEQSFTRKLFTLLVKVNPHDLEEKGFPPRQSFEFYDEENIDYKGIVEFLKGALQEEYYVELKKISKESLKDFTRNSNLDSNYSPDLFGKITFSNQSFNSLESAYIESEKPIRILLTGDDESGRKTQILDLWNKNLDKNLKSKDIILYVPFYHGYFKKTKDLFEFLYHVYFSKLIGTSYLVTDKKYKEFYGNLSNELRKKGYRLLLIFDGIEILQKYDEGFDLQDLMEVLYPNREALNTTGIILIAFKRGRISKRFKEYHVEPLSEDQIIDYLFANDIKGSLTYHSKKNLKFPKSLKKYVEGNKAKKSYFNGSGGLVDEIIESAVDSIDERRLSTLDERDRFYHSLKVFLPIFSALNSNQTFTMIDLKKSIDNTLTFLKKNNIKIDNLEYIEKEILEEFYNKDQFLEETFLLNFVDTMGFFSRDEKGIYWNNDFIRDYFRAKGITILKEQKKLTENIALEKLQEELEELRITLIRPDQDSKHFDHDVLTQVQNVYEFFNDIGQTLDTRFIANMAIALDSYGDEEIKYEFAVKALNDLIILEPGEISANELASYLSTVAYIKDKARVDIQEESPYKDEAYYALKRALDIIDNSIEGKIIETKIHGNLGSFWQKWAAKARNENNSIEVNYRENALKEHILALEIRKNLIDEIPVDPQKKKEIDYGFRRSYTAIATDYFYMRDYKKAVEYNERAILIGENISDPERYENYSRKAGALIFLYNQENNWSLDKILDILNLLLTSYKIMNSYNTIQINEVKDIYSKLNILVDKVPNIKLEVGDKEKIIEIVTIIEKAYERALNKRTKEVRQKISIL